MASIKILVKCISERYAWKISFDPNIYFFPDSNFARFLLSFMCSQIGAILLTYMNFNWIYQTKMLQFCVSFKFHVENFHPGFGLSEISQVSSNYDKIQTSARNIKTFQTILIYFLKIMQIIMYNFCLSIRTKQDLPRT